MLAGNFALAESDSIMAATGDAPMSHARLRLAALHARGDPMKLVESSIREGSQRGEGVLIRHAEDAAATFSAGRGRYDDALTWARRELSTTRTPST